MSRASTRFLRITAAFAIGAACAVALEMLAGCASQAQKSDAAQAPGTGPSEGPGKRPDAAGPAAGAQNGEVSKEAAYLATVERYSAGDREYNGFYNLFDFKATIHNSPIQNAMLKKQADYYQWDEAKLESEMAKASGEMNRETYVFCSFFTPDRRNDNLTDTKSIWRVFLDVGGRRYVGRAKKSRKLLAELQALYPYQTRWTTPYVFTFPVPVALIEGQASTLTITGPLGARSVGFAPIGGAASGAEAEGGRH
jgi:hypothetical protein